MLFERIAVRIVGMERRVRWSRLKKHSIDRGHEALERTLPRYVFNDRVVGLASGDSRNG